MKPFPKRWLRLLVGIGVPCAALLLLLACLLAGSTPPCLFYTLTGLYCIGCGSGRALFALVHGRLLAAFRFHPLLILLLPVLVYYSGKQYVAFVFGRDLLPFPAIRRRWIALGIPVFFIAFWILRNIPVFPFTLLAPTAIG